MTLTPSKAGSIHYTLDGSLPDEESPVYATPLTISGNTTLHYMMVDTMGNLSTIQTEEYVIVEPGVIAPPEEELPTLPTITGGMVARGDDEVFVYRWDESDSPQGLLVQANALAGLDEEGRWLWIVTDIATLVLSPQQAQVLRSHSQWADLHLTLRPVQDPPSGGLAGFVPVAAGFELKARLQAPTWFKLLSACGFELVIPITAHEVTQPQRLGVYGFDGENWHYVGGRLSPDGQVLTVVLGDFDQFVLKEDERSFHDLGDHWSRGEVEVLLARHIIQGMPDGNFLPNRSATRAQFAQVFANSLFFAGWGAPPVGDEVAYTDVNH